MSDSADEHAIPIVPNDDEAPQGTARRCLAKMVTALSRDDAVTDLILAAPAAYRG